jgi:hypothetical protein
MSPVLEAADEFARLHLRRVLAANPILRTEFSVFMDQYEQADCQRRAAADVPQYGPAC